MQMRWEYFLIVPPEKLWKRHVHAKRIVSFMYNTKVKRRGHLLNSSTIFSEIENNVIYMAS